MKVPKSKRARRLSKGKINWDDPKSTEKRKLTGGTVAARERL